MTQDDSLGTVLSEDESGFVEEPLFSEGDFLDLVEGSPILNELDLPPTLPVEDEEVGEEVEESGSGVSEGVEQPLTGFEDTADTVGGEGVSSAQIDDPYQDFEDLPSELPVAESAVSSDESGEVEEDGEFFENEEELGSGSLLYDPTAWDTMISWRIELARDNKGKPYKGAPARNNPASLVISDQSSGEEIASILLTPTVYSNLYGSLGTLGKVYSDPKTVTKTAKNRFDSILKWHLDHKFLGSVSALFILGFVTFVLIGFVTTAF